MSISRKLLRRAWPIGHVPIRGVHTIGGYHCVATRSLPNDHVESEWLGTSVGLRYTVSTRGSKALSAVFHRDVEIDPDDALLPNVDPADTSTWACLLLDLARAVPKKHWRQGLYEEKAKRPSSDFSLYSLALVQATRGSEHGVSFTLQARSLEIMSPRDCEARYAVWQAFPGFPRVNMLDPANALVRARIYLREELGR